MENEEVYTGGRRRRRRTHGLAEGRMSPSQPAVGGRREHVGGRMENAGMNISSELFPIAGGLEMIKRFLCMITYEYLPFQ